MSTDAAFCRKQADTERANADAATLENVRDRSARAAATWEAMADRAERAVKARNERSPVSVGTSEDA